MVMHHAFAEGDVSVRLLQGATLVATLGSTTPVRNEVALTAAQSAALAAGSLRVAVTVGGVEVMSGALACTSCGGTGIGTSRRALRGRAE